jgi:hypothetical protein
MERAQRPSSPAINFGHSGGTIHILDIMLDGGERDYYQDHNSSILPP